MIDNFFLTPFKWRIVTPKIINNQKYINNVDENKFLTGYPLNKFWTFDFIETISDYIDFDDIKTIFDIGSRDGHQSIEFRTWFPKSEIIAFEANPNQINEIKNNTQFYNIKIESFAASNLDGESKFYLLPANIGASSLYKTNNHHRSKEWRDSGGEHEIIVKTERLDTYINKNNINSPDLLWIDVQGAEKLVIDGIGDFIYDIKAICTEIELTPMYNGSTLKEELDSILLDKGFINIKTFHMCPKENLTLEELKNIQGEVDSIYVNKKFIKYGNII